MDDLGRSGEKIRNPGNGCLEVAGDDVGLAGCRVPESLDQEIHRRVVSAPRPLEADIAWFCSRSGGEILDHAGKVASVLRPYPMPDDDEDHAKP
jgi:hypothetical protein